MAAQCRSPRCTAERKGFRRELDSWRHRLIHCVGFESILEGLYGPGLRRDLSLFDDCEPEELVDWCVDEKCSLCSLRKEADCTSSGGSAQSTPTGEVISQGQFNTDKIECQAENYLNALFQKKDLPQNCDPNIPLVAQELMKKMIRQFAIEYVSKSRKMYQDNGTMVDSPHGCNGFQLNQTESLLQEEQDGPLDLTVTRIQEHSYQDEDGVLDLSVKRSGLEENSKIKNLKLDVINGYFLRKLKKVTKRPKENTALTKVLAAYCLYHRQQLALMLKFLREEQKTCSQVCCGHFKISQQTSKRTKKSPAMLYSCTKEKLRNHVSLKEQVSSANLPYLSVRLKDLRLTWPNLALGTVKLNPIKDEDLHLRSNDQVLHCINTRSKQKKLVIQCSSRYRAISCSSSLPRLKLQRVTKATRLDGAIVKNYLQYRSESASHVSIKNKSCQTEGIHKTVIKSSNINDSTCSVDGKQNNSMPTENNATSQISHDKYKIGSLHFGNLIKHLLNNSKKNHFVELLNQDTNNFTGNTGIQTRLRKSQQNLPVQSGSLTRNQSLELTNNLNASDTFPKEKNGSGEKMMNSTEHMDKAVGTKKGNICDILVIKNPENTPTESVAQEIQTGLPHSESKLHSKNVNCVKNSQPFLPEGSRILAAENVTTRKRRSLGVSVVECNIPFKRYSRNILGKCKLCDASHGQCSYSGNNNLFCKCTIKQNSGILKNFKMDGLVGRYTTDKGRNAHLKVVVERLKNTFSSGVQIPEVGNRETRKSVVSQGKRHVLPSDQLSINTVKSAKSSDYLSSRSAPRKEQGDSVLYSKSVNTASCRNSENKYFSPIKLMFASKIESEDKVKYALSPVYTLCDYNRVSQSSAALRKHSNDVQKSNNAMSECSNQSGNSNNLINPQYTVIASSSLSKGSMTTQNNQEEANTVRRKLRSNRVDHHSVSILKKSDVKQSKPKHLNKETSVKTKNDLKISIPCKTKKSVTHSKITDIFEESRATETYVAKNISSTQIKIKKLHKILEPPVTSDTNAELPGDQPERENCKISIRFSTRLQKLGTSSIFSNLRVVSESSEQEQVKNQTEPLLDVQQENGKKADDQENCQASQNLYRKTKREKRKIQKSRLIRRQTLSNYMTRSKKSPFFTLYYGSQSKFSLRCALLHKSKKHSFGKSKHYRRKLRSYKQQHKPPLNSVDNEDQSPCTSTVSDVQANTAVEWWSTTTSNETLLKHLENRYEHIANTWVTENNVAGECEMQSSLIMKFSSSESRSPIQMLFQKKCDMNDLATWFMQTTETQSLSIVRKANARRPLHVINEKRSKKKAKPPSINSSKKYLNKCRQLKQPGVLEELHGNSNFKHPESISLKISKDKYKNNLKCNSLQSSNNKTKDVCVKFSCPGDILDLTELCTTKVINAAESTITKSVQLTKDDLKGSTGCEESSRSSHKEPAARNCSEQQISTLKQNNPKYSTNCLKNKLNIKDCKVFLRKCGSQETKLLSSSEVSTDGNSKSTGKSGMELKATRTNNTCHMGKTLAQRRCLKRINTLKCGYKMCLRGGVVKRDGHCNGSVQEKRKKDLRFALDRGKNKQQHSATGRVPTEFTKLQIGPLKPVGFPATRGLVHKYGSYSLTPIRIPLK